jgi:hypothetical protein
MSERMSDDRARPGVLGRGSPARQVVLVLLAYVVVGAIAGAVWEWVWTPPVHIIRNHQVYYASYASLRRVFTGTGLYALVGAAASALLSVVVCLLTRRRELVTLASVLVGSVLAALVMRLVGGWLGPADPLSIAATAADNTQVPGSLVVTGRTAYLVWPVVSLFVLALVFFAWPGADPTSSHDHTSDPAEAGAPGAERR